MLYTNLLNAQMNQVCYWCEPVRDRLPFIGQLLYNRWCLDLLANRETFPGDAVLDIIFESCFTVVVYAAVCKLLLAFSLAFVDAMFSYAC